MVRNPTVQRIQRCGGHVEEGQRIVIGLVDEEWMQWRNEINVNLGRLNPIEPRKKG